VSVKLVFEPAVQPTGLYIFSVPQGPSARSTSYAPGVGEIPVHVTVIWLFPGTEAGPIVGALAGRARHAAAGHCPGPLPFGQTAEAICVDQLLAARKYWPTYQNVQSSNGSTLMLV
jgi:hypothetical protein